VLQVYPRQRRVLAFLSIQRIDIFHQTHLRKGTYFSVEKLAIKVQIVKPNIEKDKSLFRPYKSANLPPSRRKPPDVKLKAPGIHEISPCVIPRSLAIISKPTKTPPLLAAYS
jgi:hypothetical protein